MSVRWPLAVLVLALVAFFGPILAGSEVVFPHDNAYQVGLASEESGEGSNLRFSDQSSFYVPELQAHLTAPRSGWIATWTDAVEMGRPLTHLSGFSPAYPPTWLLMHAVDDPFVVYTWLFALTVAATAAFAFLFFRALELDPWVCGAGACAAAFGVPVLYWSSFVMYASGLCWTFALLWLVTGEVERPSCRRWIAIAAACCALLLSGYPQQIVWHGAFVVAWALARIARSPASTRERLVRVARLAGAAGAGVIAASPVLLDVALAYSRSARTRVDPEFFVSALPSVGTWSELAAQVALLFDPRLLGDPIAPGFRFLYHGVAFGPLIGFAVLSSWRGGAWREHVACHAFLVTGLALSFWPSAYRWAVEHAGLGLSTTPPCWGAFVPALVCGTRAIDALVRRRARAPLGVAIGTAVLGLGAVAGVRWASAPWVAAGREGSWIVALALAAAALGVLLLVRRGPAVALVAIAIAFVEGRELVLARPRASIHTSSPLVDGLRERLAGGGRYAIVGDRPRFVLPANEELLLGLRSPHSYDSLSPRAYQEWVLRLSKEGTRNYGRRFNRIADEALLASGELEKAGITHVLAAQPLRAPNLRPDARLGPFLAYATSADTSRVLVLPADRVHASGASASTTGAWTRADAEAVHVVADLGDRLHLRLDPARDERWLVLRRQFHPQWRASSGGDDLDCADVDGFYQGVRVPAGTEDVVLEFRPYARWAWIPWPVFALGFAWAALAGRRRLA